MSISFEDIIGLVGALIWECLGSSYDTILNLMLVSKSCLKSCLELNNKIPMYIDYKRYFLSAMVPSRIVVSENNENIKMKNLMSIIKTFPKIYCLKLAHYGQNYRKFGVSLIYLYRNDILRFTLENLQISINCNEALCYISDLENLNSLALIWCINISNQGMVYLSDLKKLRSLTFVGCFSVKSTDFKPLRCLTNLLYLDLSFCEHVTDYVMDCIKDLKQLNIIKLRDCHRISNIAVVIIANNFKNLEELCISNCIQITGEGLNNLVSLNKLHILDIQMCSHINDEDRHILMSFDFLETLKLFGTMITDKVFHELKCKIKNVHVSFVAYENCR